MASVRIYFSGHPASSCISILHDYFFPGALGCVEKEKAKYFSLGINHISCALSAAALLGTAGYCLTGMDTVDAGIAGKVVTAEDGRAWDENREMLRQWKEDVYEELPDRDRQELFQALINLECGYWGIEPIPLEIETYESDTLMGYYVDEYYVISIRKEMFDMPREEVMDTLLHEVHHAYVHKPWKVWTGQWEDKGECRAQDLCGSEVL